MKKDKILIIGPLLENETEKVTSPGTVLANYLENNASFQVIRVGRYKKRAKRLYEIVKHILANKDANVAILLVFSGKNFLYTDIASFLLRQFNIPIIFWLHGGALPEFSKKYKKWVDRVLKRGKAMVAPSEYLAEHFRKTGYSNIRIIRNIINVNEYRFVERHSLRPRFLWMRKFHPIWNPNMALHVFKKILKIYPGASLVMSGADEGYMKKCINIAQELGIREHVSFPGYLNHEKKTKYMSENDIYLHTNLIDNAPVSVIEALASGMIVVGTDVGGMPYIIKNGYNGFLVKTNDIDAMTQKIIELLEGKHDIISIQRNGYKTALKFHYDKVIEEWNKLLQEIKR